MVTFDSTYLKYHFYELKEWKWYLDGFITGILCPTQFYIHIFNNFWFFWIYITKTQVLVTCSILCCIMGSYLLFTSTLCFLPLVFKFLCVLMIRDPCRVISPWNVPSFVEKMSWINIQVVNKIWREKDQHLFAWPWQPIDLNMKRV